ncbi:MAG TPA: hypothetical protein EYN66_19570, partial [Myxococcales bacterium]|nr:hypothetical protein [Myxococcales bacterium]
MRGRITTIRILFLGLAAVLSLPACGNNASPSLPQPQSDTSQSDTELESDVLLRSDTPPSGDVIRTEDVPVVPGKATPWGIISGSCGSLGAELTRSQPGYFENTYT